MKKLTLFSLLVLIMASCTINEDEPDTYWKVVDVTVYERDWKLHTDNNGLNPCYYCDIDMPEISSYVYNSGLIQSYYVKKTTPRFQESLPYVRHFEEGSFRWTTTLDCTYNVGKMTFYYTNSDFFIDDRPRENMYFRVVLMW